VAMACCGVCYCECCPCVLSGNAATAKPNVRSVCSRTRVFRVPIMLLEALLPSDQRKISTGGGSATSERRTKSIEDRTGWDLAVVTLGCEIAQDAFQRVQVPDLAANVGDVLLGEGLHLMAVKPMAPWPSPTARGSPRAKSRAGASGE